MNQRIINFLNLLLIFHFTKYFLSHCCFLYYTIKINQSENNFSDFFIFAQPSKMAHFPALIIPILILTISLHVIVVFANLPFPLLMPVKLLGPKISLEEKRGGTTQIEKSTTESVIKSTTPQSNDITEISTLGKHEENTKNSESSLETTTPSTEETTVNLFNEFKQIGEEF